MNSAYIGKLMEIAEKDQNVIHLLADSGTGFDEMFHRSFPEQFYNFGIGEENMVAAAAGMATVGKIPFVFTAGAFLAYRSMEFIRNDVCFQNLNVKIVGMGSGFSWSALGPTHHTTEDISVLRAIPNLMILSPATPKQLASCVELAYRHLGPVYIRMEMNHEKEYFEDKPGELWKNQILFDFSEKSNVETKLHTKKILIYVTGSILSEAYEASLRLRNDGFAVKLVDITKIKPFPEEEVLKDLEDCNNIAVIEEHNIHGGLAGAIAETMAYNGVAGRLTPIGLKDKFAEGYGTINIVRRANSLDADSLYLKLKEML